MKNCRWAGWLAGGVNGDPMNGLYLSAWEIARDLVGNAPTVKGFSSLQFLLPFPLYPFILLSKYSQEVN